MTDKHIPDFFLQLLEEGCIKESDIVKTDWGSSSGQFMLFINAAGNYIYDCPINQTESGTSTSAMTGAYYRTDTNYLYPNNDSSLGSYSLPIAIISKTGTTIDSIDQVFNGLGFIGSTVYVLPGVKAYTPKGTTIEGTLYEEPITTTSVLTKTLTSTSGQRKIVLSATSLEVFQFMYSEPISGYITYQEEENYNYASLNKYVGAIIGDVIYDNNSKISSFSPYYVFRAVDYNDKNFIAHQSLPSSQYTDLTLPATGNTLIMPADGYLTIAKAIGAASEYLTVINNTNNLALAAYPTSVGYSARVYLPVSKNDVITVNYSASGSTLYCRLVYSNGSK